MRKSFGLLIALATTALPAMAQNSGLERLSRPDQVQSWKAVGRVDLAGEGYCTGTLIAADLVLTAAHCLFDSRGKPVDPAKITFRAGFADGASIAESGVARAVAHDEYTAGTTGTSNARQVQRDVALLQLAQPISTALAPPFAVSSPGKGDEVSVVSYARGRSEALSWQRACTVLGRQQGLIAVDCDVTFGASGAPVFDRSYGRAQIVSIISGGGSDGSRDFALGMELPKLVTDLKAQLRAGRGVVEAQGAPATAAIATPKMPGSAGKRIAVGQGGTGTRAGGARFIKAPSN